MSAETYQERDHFKALNEPVLMATSKIFEQFFSISISPAGLCIKSTLETFTGGLRKDNMLKPMNIMFNQCKKMPA